MLADDIKREIIESLRGINPYKVILFGSYAWGTPHKDSDIDLYVVINEEGIPESYEENMAMYLQVSRRLRDLKKRFPTDIIVHSKPMNKKFVELKSSLAKKILDQGVVLYERS